MDLTRDTVEFGIQTTARGVRKGGPGMSAATLQGTDSCDPTPRVRFGVDEASLGPLDAIGASRGGRPDDRRWRRSPRP